MTTKTIYSITRQPGYLQLDGRPVALRPWLSPGLPLSLYVGNSFYHKLYVDRYWIWEQLRQIY